MQFAMGNCVFHL